MTIPIADNVEIFVHLNGVCKSYREGEQDVEVLQNLNGKVKKGETTAVIGRSGSGKTTLLNVISGMDVPDLGEVWVGSSNLTAMNDRQRTLFRRHHIGFVFQFFNLIPTLTVYENVLFPLQLIDGADSEGQRWAKTLLEQVGLAGRLATFPDQLSGGERQRVAIARALVHRPSLLLADEPTGNLDQETGIAVLNLMTQLVAEYRQTLIMVTHSMVFARQAHRILTMERGHLLESICQEAL
ncbi:MAG: ABC transporter ATP-binding protein [Magnetococcales bacterium]|nr:ABC transporter ATP-binding protein [Magnetococcales bacterium]HIJ82759.1 ABC transporter ATP-binding protein [Magnetococcales bacterium]